MSKYPNVDLNKADAIGALTMAIERGEVRWGETWYGRSTEVLYNGRWLTLARTDYSDDVRTNRYHLRGETPADNVRFHIDRIWFGARVDDDAFYIVDALTDG